MEATFEPDLGQIKFKSVYQFETQVFAAKHHCLMSLGIQGKHKMTTTLNWSRSFKTRLDAHTEFLSRCRLNF